MAYILSHYNYSKKTIFYFCSYFNLIKYLLQINGLLKIFYFCRQCAQFIYYIFHLKFTARLYVCYYVNYNNFPSLSRAIVVGIVLICIQYTKLTRMFPSEVVFRSNLCFFPVSAHISPKNFLTSSSSLTTKWIFLSNLLLKSQNPVVIGLKVLVGILYI